MSYKSKKRNGVLWERILKKLFFIYIVPVVIVFTASIFFVNADFFRIKSTNFVNIQNSDMSYLLGIFNESIEGKYFGLYNKNNFLLYPESKAEEKLLEVEKRIKSADISYSSFSGDIEVDIKEKTAVFLYCVNKKTDCYFMEKNGQIFVEFNQTETDILKSDFLVFFEDGVDGVITDIFWEESTFQKVLSLVDKLKAMGIEIKSIEKNEFEEVILYTKNNSKIIVLINQDFDKIIETLEKVSTKKDLYIDKILKDFETKIEYINLSHGENVFYCSQGKKCAGNY